MKLQIYILSQCKVDNNFIYMVKIKLLPANNGDSILVTYVSSNNQNETILIDSGTANFYKNTLKQEFISLYNSNQVINLLIITHIDSDHIGGIVKFVEDLENGRLDYKVKTPIEKYWFNSSKTISSHFQSITDPDRLIPISLHSSPEISVKQGQKLEDFLEQTGKWHQSLILTGQVHSIKNFTLTILSPNEASLRKLNEVWQTELSSSQPTNISAQSTDYNEKIYDLSSKPFIHDTGLPNASSIGFLANIEDKNLLFLGDSYPSVIAESLTKLGYSINNKLKAECVKLSHHGSKHNTSYDLLSLIECSKFLVSSNGLNKDKLPNKEALSRILCDPSRDKRIKVEFYFNYDNTILREIFSSKEEEEYNFTCIFPKDNICELSL